MRIPPACLLVVGWLCTQPLPVPAWGQTLPSLRPCNVRVEVRWPHSTFLPTETRLRVMTELQSLATRTVGSHWSVEFVDGELEGNDLATLERWSPQPADVPLPEQLDKQFVVGLIEQGSGLELAGLEWDPLVASRSRVLKKFVADTDCLADGVWNLVHAAYRPVGEIVRNRAGELRLEARAAELVPPDPRWSPLQTGQLWEPYYRFLAADQTVQKIQAVPWTYLSVGDVERRDAEIKVITGIRNPITGRKRRLQTVALRSTPPANAGSHLTLRNRGNMARPMAGLEVRLFKDEKGTPEVLVADRLGTVAIPPHPGGPPVWLQIYSGQELLARVPFLAGLKEAVTLDLPDDSIRLRVEGEISLLQADLVDTVARRATILATARQRSKQGNVEGVVESLSQLPELKKVEEFNSQLAMIRVSGTTAAKAQKNRAAELRIQKLCDDTAALISGYLHPDKLRQMEEEAQDLKEIAEENRKALRFGNTPKTGKTSAGRATTNPATGKAAATPPAAKAAVPKTQPAAPRPAPAPEPKSQPRQPQISL